MKAFLDCDFLLSTSSAERLYHEFAEPCPIYDYHCHLPVEEIADDRRFENLSQIWLEGDHYKWRAMRAAGIDEALITGKASDYAKYQAWAETVPQCLGNPLYHWTHLELKRPFGIDGVLFGPESAASVWDTCNGLLSEPEYSARGIMKQMNVRMVGTTDDPLDSLEHHRKLSDETDFEVKVLPTWRPDALFKIGCSEFEPYRDRLAQIVGFDIKNWDSLLEALSLRLNYFEELGCICSDHGMEVVRFDELPSASALNTILEKSRVGRPITELEISEFCSALHVWMAKEYTRRGWVMQLHIGAIRDTNSRLLSAVGANAGCDSIGDRTFAEPLAKLLNAMEVQGHLPKTILYCLNARDNDVLATMAGNFQGGGTPGKIQFGSGWWFNDQKTGMLAQLTSLANMGLLSRFVGMLTDSRSFLSYTRHEYFRRILCDLLGGWIENGELPADYDLVGGMVEDICFRNVMAYFNFTSDRNDGVG